jgi:hypothetical protein
VLDSANLRVGVICFLAWRLLGRNVSLVGVNLVVEERVVVSISVKEMSGSK